MGMHTTKVAVGEGKFTLEAQLTVTPRGMVVYACSPEFAHLGATAQAIPRPEPGRTATVSILAVPCHRDEIPAHDIAAALATRFGVPVTASTGFHVEQASKDDLQRVLNTTKAHRRARRNRGPHIACRLGRGRCGCRGRGGRCRDRRVLTPVDRIKAHTGEGILHQAFLTLLVEGQGEDTRLLLCRRSPLKRLWGGVLADSCAAIRSRGGRRRCDGVASTKSLASRASPASSSLGHVVYREDHGDGRCECEWCEVYLARVESGELHINQEEISEVRRVAPPSSMATCKVSRAASPWLREALSDPTIRAVLAM
ncbi:MAG: hypothetical protein ACLRM9_06075 [Collinsella aerofaciens]